MIQPSPTAPLGSVSTLSPYSLVDFTSDSAILCRNTAPLIAFAYGLINRNLACRVLGREIGKGLTQLIEKLNAKTIDSLEEKLTTYREREYVKAMSKGNASGAAAIEDKCDCITVFINNLKETERTIRSLCSKIEALFSDEGSAKGQLTLATIHKSKGLEWPTVFLLDRSLLPSKYATQPWQKTQENNLLYVAVTRAKLNLRYISSGNWKVEGKGSEAQVTTSKTRTALLED